MKRFSNPVAYYNKIKDEQHVFIFSVGGRSSSTAFQRLLNSSNEVWIWGERKELVEQIISCSKLAEELSDHRYVLASSTLMHQCYLKNKHDEFYPLATGNLKSTIQVLESSIANLLRPWADIKRFGYKDIRVSDIFVLDYLRGMFPNSFFLFCFRNPVDQWPSMKAAGWDWKLPERSINGFLKMYCHLAKIYSDFAETHGKTFFIENTTLRDMEKISHLLEKIGISEIDYELMETTVSSFKSHITADEQAVIMGSEAYRFFVEMRKSSNAFFEGNGGTSP